MFLPSLIVKDQYLSIEKKEMDDKKIFLYFLFINKNFQYYEYSFLKFHKN